MRSRRQNVAVLYRCPRCKELSNATSWRSMPKSFGPTLLTYLPSERLLDEVLFSCPKCGKASRLGSVKCWAT